MASVRKSQTSPFWLSDMRVWKAVSGHPHGGYVCKTSKSTKIPITVDKATAKRAADEMERIGNEHAPGATMDRATFERRVESLMRAAGVEPPINNSTWCDFSERWLDEIGAGQSSMIKYRGEVGQFTRFLGARAKHSLRTISHEDFSRFYLVLQKEGRAASTARNTAKTVRAVFAKAIALGLVERNPGELIRLKSDGNATARQPFTTEDLKAIFAVCTPEWRTACLFGLYYGMRLGDATTRKYEEITVENGIRVIRFVPEKKARGGKEISLPLVGELDTLQGKGFITPRLATYTKPSYVFSKILDASKIAIKRKNAKGKGRAVGNKSFHSFRHTANSRLADAGVDMKLRQLICDHDDISVNLGYTHGSVEAMKAAITGALAAPAAIGAPAQ